MGKTPRPGGTKAATEFYNKQKLWRLNILFHQVSDTWTGEAEVTANGKDFIVLRLKSDLKEVKAKLRVVTLVENVHFSETTDLISVESPYMSRVYVSAIPSAVIAVMMR